MIRKLKKKSKKKNVIIESIRKNRLSNNDVKMKHLNFDYNESYYSGDKRHAQEVMADLGIKYEFSVPQSIGDCFWFFNCTDIPEILPSYVEFKGFSIDDYNYWKR